MSSFWSWIQAPVTFSRVLLARLIPSLMASSKLMVEDDEISAIFATDMMCPFSGGTGAGVAGVVPSHPPLSPMDVPGQIRLGLRRATCHLQDNFLSLAPPRADTAPGSSHC